MSGNTDSAKIDRRVRRTRNTLGDALVELMQEKPFDSITVQEVLDRAGVGRSTFYAHYRDKDDLFLSDVEDFFGMMSTLLQRQGAGPERVAPVREFAAHIADVRPFYLSLVASGKIRDVMELGQGTFARSIEERLLLSPASRALEPIALEPIALKAHAQALAGAMFSLITWWVDRGAPITPEALDAMFHRMVWTGLAAPTARPAAPAPAPVPFAHSAASSPPESKL